MRWHVYIDERTYGPYTLEQLTAFLKPGTLVAREGQSTWIEASKAPELEDVLAGRVQPKQEWHIARPNKSFQGPFTRQALMAMIERKEIHPTDQIIHDSWSEAMPLGQTRLYAKWKDPSISLDDLSAAQIRNAPRPKTETSIPSPNKFLRLMGIQEAMPQGAPTFIAVALILLSAYAWHVFSTVGRDPLCPSCGMADGSQVDTHIREVPLEAHWRRR